MAGAGSLRVNVLGDLVAIRAGAVLPLGGRRQRAVLAALVMARGEAVAVDTLVDSVWGSEAPGDPAGTLQSYVSHLRRGLEPTAGARDRARVIARTAGGYAIRLEPDAVDAWRFERVVASSPSRDAGQAAEELTQALALWRGPAYAEYADEPWAAAEAARLEELRQVARERLLGARLDLDQAPLLVGELEALLAADPLREERWRLLVLALWRAHRQADALAALRRARAALRDALGVDPGPALRSLEREVLAHAPSLDAARPPTATAVTVPRPARAALEAPGAAPGSADLAERDTELTRLREAVAALETGGGGLVVVEGPPGIGKTALLAATLGIASNRGLTVLAARCGLLEQSSGFGVVRQLLDGVLDDDGRREQLLTGPAAAAREVLTGVGDTSGGGSFAVLQALHRLTARLAEEQPLLVAVDDLQWCDIASLRYLAYLGKRLHGPNGARVLLVVTVRTGAEPVDAVPLDELVLDPDALLLAPGPLSVGAVRDLVTARLGEPDEPFVQVCHTTTAGNPLLLRQLLRALEAAGVRPDLAHVDTVRAIGSRAVSGLVTLRLRRMQPEATAVARAVAVLGPHGDLPTIAAFAGLPEARSAEMLDHLTRGEVLVDRRPPDFVHPLVRDAVYLDQPAEERSRQHERAAQVLRQRGACADDVAAHLLQSPRRGDATTVELLTQAAASAAAAGATESAVTLLRRALDEPAVGEQHTDVLARLGLLETLVDGPAAVAHLGQACDALADPHRRAEVAAALVRAHLFASPPGVATVTARAAVAALPLDAVDDRQALHALQRISGHLHGLPPDRYRVGDVALSGSGVGARMLAAVLAYERLLDGRDREEAVRLARSALEDDVLLEADNGLLWVVAAVVLELSDAGLPGFWERAAARAQRTGSLFAVLSANLWQGYAEWRRGGLDEALVCAQHAAQQGTLWGGSHVSLAYATAFAAGVLLDRRDEGDLDSAERLLHDTAWLPELGEGSRLLREAEVRLLLEQGHADRALTAVAAVEQPPGTTNPAWCGWRRLKAEALARLGRLDEALALAGEEVALLRRWGAPSPLGVALHARAALPAWAPMQRGAPSDGAALADLREAVDLLEATGATLGLARALATLGCHPATSDTDAVPLLRRSLDLATACGASGTVREARSGLAVRGAPEEAATLVPGGPTSRQRQARALAAAGHGVADIARRMFLPVAAVQLLLAGSGPVPGSTPHPPPDHQVAGPSQVRGATLSTTRPWSPM